MYFLGNSTGLQPKGACDIVAREMAKWAEKGIEGHFVGDIPWLEIEEHVVADLATLVGARPLEVTIMNTLTVNIHQAMVRICLDMLCIYIPVCSWVCSSHSWILLVHSCALLDTHSVISGGVLPSH